MSAGWGRAPENQRVMGMRSVTSRDWAQGVRAAVPIVVGYLPAATAFGVAARQAGLSVAETLLMSVLVYAGASQFALAGMVGAGMPAAAAAVTGLVLNVRHVLYGPALAPWLPKLGKGTAAVGAFGLTDEVFAVASAVLPRERASARWLLGLEAAAYASWLVGTWLGAAGGQAVVARLPAVAGAMSFALPALFVALLVPLLLPAGPSGAQSGDRPGTPGRGKPLNSEAATRQARGVRVSAAVGAVVTVAMWLAGWSRWSVLAAGALGPLAGLGAARLAGRRASGGPARRRRGAEGGLERA